MTNSVSISYSPHKLWGLYQKYPPIEYRNSFMPSKYFHSFNVIKPRFLSKKNIIEFEHILHLTGESRDYVKMIDGACSLFEKLKDDKIIALISPTKIAIDYCEKYFREFSQIKNKFHKIPPAVITRDFRERKINNYLNLLFIGNKFWGKGGNIAISVTKALHEQGIPVFLKMVCNDIPADYPIPEYVNILDCKKLGEKEKDHLYDIADLFLFPVLHDSFGVHMECLEHSVPMITTSIYDKSEIIKEGINGYLVKPPFELYGDGFATNWNNWDAFNRHIMLYEREKAFVSIIDELAEKITYFYDDKQKIIEFKLGMLSHSKTQFSIERRNNLLKNLYHSLN